MKDDRLYLIHILECIERIERYTLGGRSGYFADTMVQDAVIRNLQTLSESIRRISGTLKEAHSGVNWRNISAFRNVVVHDYLGIDLNQIWDIVEKDLPDLKRQIEAILRGPGETA
jgi:uncharacterized protein with HEPN domain